MQETPLKVVVETASSGKQSCFSFPLKCKDLKAFLLTEIGGWAVVSLQRTQMQLNNPRWNLKYSIAASWAASALTATGEGCKGSHLVIHQHFYTLSSAACLEGRCATFLKIQLDDSSQFSFILSVAEPSKAFFQIKETSFSFTGAVLLYLYHDLFFHVLYNAILIRISTFFLLLKWDTLACNSQICLMPLFFPRLI